MATKKKKVLIIGYGEIGKAIDFLLDKTRVSSSGWDINARRRTSKKPLEKLVAESKIIFVTVPSWGLRDALESIKGVLDDDTLIVSLSKGIEKNTNKLPYQIIEEVLPRNSYSYLAGPMLAEEIMQKKMAGAICASSSRSAYKRTRFALKKEQLTLQYSEDVYSVSLCSVLKNVYSLFVGVLRGAGYENNAFGITFPTILSEMQRIVGRLGGNELMVFSMAGIGDLVATASSPYSSNRKSGEALLKKKKVVCEGFYSVHGLQTLLDGNTAPFPYVEILLGVCDGKKKKADIVELLNK